MNQSFTMRLQNWQRTFDGVSPSQTAEYVRSQLEWLKRPNPPGTSGSKFWGPFHGGSAGAALDALDVALAERDARDANASDVADVT